MSSCNIFTKEEVEKYYPARLLEIFAYSLGFILPFSMISDTKIYTCNEKGLIIERQIYNRTFSARCSSDDYCIHINHVVWWIATTISMISFSQFFLAILRLCNNCIAVLLTCLAVLMNIAAFGAIIYESVILAQFIDSCDSTVQSPPLNETVSQQMEKQQKGIYGFGCTAGLVKARVTIFGSIPIWVVLLVVSLENLYHQIRMQSYDSDQVVPETPEVFYFDAKNATHVTAQAFPPEWPKRPVCLVFMLSPNNNEYGGYLDPMEI